jgi:hypothetical protein
MTAKIICIAIMAIETEISISVVEIPFIGIVSASLQKH